MNERLDTTKAAAWALVAAFALSLHVLASGLVAGPQLYGLLSVLGFGLLLPPIAILHVRFTPIGPQAAILATIAGTATSISGVGALAFGDLQPGALFFLAMWWWVVGKFSVETGLLPRTFGYATMALSLLAFAATVGDVVGVRAGWTAARLALAAWLIVLAGLLYRTATRDAADAG